MLPITDYAHPGHWLAAGIDDPHDADVFYLYPTAWGRHGSQQRVCPVDFPEMRRGAQTVFGVQASVFFPLARVFAPYYRQLHPATAQGFRTAATTPLVPNEPFEDAVAAFDYYWTHWNGGRPFFVFAHSQGAAVAKQLVFETVARHPDRLRGLVAAYLIGFGVARRELDACPGVPFARRADDTGVIVSYNTEPPGSVGVNPTVPDDSVAINPLTWTLDEPPAPASANPGSLITGGGTLTVLRGFADARVDRRRGVVVCSSVDVGVYGGPPPLSPFHALDVGLYYASLRQNARDRLAAWRKQYGNPAPHDAPLHA